MLMSVAVALLMLNDHDNLYIVVDDWLIGFKLSVAILILLMIYFLFSISFRLLMRLFKMSEHLHNWQIIRRSTLAAETQQKALLELSRGHWRAAEREFIRHVKYTDTPLLGYLNAARAAQHQSAIDRRDQYLQLAHESDSQAALSIGITQAEVYILHHQFEQALAILTNLQMIEPKNTHIFDMLFKLYKELNDWNQLSKLIPQLRKHQVLSSLEITELEFQIYKELLGSASEVDELTSIWLGMSKSLKDNIDLIYLYARKIINKGKSEVVEPLLRVFLKKKWDENIVYLYSLLEVDSVAAQLATIEKLTEEHGKNPILLLSLGKVCMRNQLWGKARIYLESSIGAGPGTEAYQTLGGLLENMGDQEGALECYRKGMSLARAQVPGKTNLPGEHE